MDILITGGAGFIGANLAAYHLNQQDSVHVIDDLSTGTLANLRSLQNHPHFRFTKADILTYPGLADAVLGVDRIYHMAAVVGVLQVIALAEQVLRINIESTARLLGAIQLSKTKPRILLASSSEVYGEGRSQSFSEHSEITIGSGKQICQPYIISKLATEAYGLSYFNHYGLNVTNLRIFNTIGPGQTGGYGMVVPRFIQAALAHQPIPVYGSGAQIRSFCDVRDLVALMDCVANTPATIGKNINLGHDQAISILELAQCIKELAESDSEIEHIAYDAVYGKGFQDIMFRKPDLTELIRLTHYQFQWNLEKTLADLIGQAPW